MVHSIKVGNFDDSWTKTPTMTIADEKAGSSKRLGLEWIDDKTLGFDFRPIKKIIYDDEDTPALQIDIMRKTFERIEKVVQEGKAYIEKSSMPNLPRKK